MTRLSDFTTRHNCTTELGNFKGISGCYLLCSSGGPQQVHTRKDGSTRIVIARHYIGWSADIGDRLEHHRAGNGSKLVAHWNKMGVSWVLSRVWIGKDGDFERQLHNCRNSPKLLCPICRQQKVMEQLAINQRKLAEILDEPVSKLDWLGGNHGKTD